MTGSAAKWNLGTMLAAVCIKHTPVPPRRALPFAWHTVDISQDWGVLDVHDVMRGVAAAWRSTEEVSEQHFSGVRVLESVVHGLLEQSWPDDTLQDCCQILARLWGAERLFDTLLAQPHGQVPDPDPDTYKRMCEWVHEHRDLAVRAEKTDSLVQPVLSASMRLGEIERYARNNGGIEAKNLNILLTSTRTHVQASFLQKGSAGVDTDIACGTVITLLVDRVVRHKTGLAWHAQNVVLDVEMMSEQLVKVST